MGHSFLVQPYRLHWVLLINAFNMCILASIHLIKNETLEVLGNILMVFGLIYMIVMIERSFRSVKLQIENDVLVIGNRTLYHNGLKAIAFSSKQRSIWFYANGWSRPGFRVDKDESYEEMALTLRAWAYRHQIHVKQSN